jgi:holo-[acyl-carrier protein] synthase
LIIGLGIDIIEIDRIESSVERYGERFLEKIYTEGEREYCMSKGNRIQHLAARFAAKEAVAKALGAVYRGAWSWQNIEVFNAINGEPFVKLNGNLENLINENRILKISMSHSRDYVTAVAILSEED